MTGGKFPERGLREFLAEAGEIVDLLGNGFADIDTQRRSGEVSPATLNEVFRGAHSLKGLAGMFGIDAISLLAHEMENLLDALRLGRLALSDGLIQVLYACNDAFHRLLTDVRNGRTTDDEGIRSLLGRIEAAVIGDAIGNGDSGFQKLALPRESLTVLTEYEEHRLSQNLKNETPIYRVHAPLDLANFDQALSALTDTINGLGEVITTLPSSEGGAGIDFDIVFAAKSAESVVRKAIEEAGNGAYTLERVDVKTEEKAPEPAPAVHLPAELESADTTLRQVSETVRVDIKKLDELMGIVGELVLARGGLARVTDELKHEMGYRGVAVDLHRLVNTLDRRVADLQGAIMQVRMIPLGQVFDRLGRIVRRTASELHKEVELVVSGEETELDKLIVEDLIDPLMHLVRNSIDHGIETESARTAKGKPAHGTVWLRAIPRGNHVVIEIQDDGAGIDEFAVKRTALERGVVDEERVGTLTQKEIWGLIFAAGFTTRKSVTETSGRGVGLDVVKTNIARLSGLIDVDSTAGEGTKFTITLPISLAIIQALIIRCKRSMFALPLASVLEILAVDERDLCYVDGREMIRVRDATLPILRLSDVFGLKEDAAHADNDDIESLGYVAVVGLAQHRVALFVDDVTGQQDVVIKSLGTYLEHVHGIAGATQMGDHETILVLDVGALVQEFVGAHVSMSRGQASL